MIDCKISENRRRQHLGLQMYEFKIIQFKIDCKFWNKNQNGGTL